MSSLSPVYLQPVFCFLITGDVARQLDQWDCKSEFSHIRVRKLPFGSFQPEYLGGQSMRKTETDGGRSLLQWWQLHSNWTTFSLLKEQLLTVFGKSLVKNHGASLLATRQWSTSYAEGILCCYQLTQLVVKMSDLFALNHKVHPIMFKFFFLKGPGHFQMFSMGSFPDG